MKKYIYVPVIFFIIIFTNTAFADVVIDSFTAKPESGNAPLEVIFTCKASTTDGSTIAQFRLDADDGSDDRVEKRIINGSATFTVNYKAGIYNPVCTVVDSNGNQASKSLKIVAQSGISGDYNNNGTLGLEDCIGILQELTQ